MSTPTFPHCHLATGLGPLVPIKGKVNVAVYKDVPNNCVLLSLWQRVGQGSHMGETDRCPHTFSNIVYLSVKTKSLLHTEQEQKLLDLRENITGARNQIF